MNACTELTRTWYVNGAEQTVRFAPLSRLLDVLRDVLGLTSLKEGCGEGECGACTVLINGELELACLVAAAQLDDGSELLTAEGLGDDVLGQKLQRAFDDGGAVQCGYCTPGVMLASFELLRREPNPSEPAIREALAGNICRCTGYTKIITSVEAAAAAMRAGDTRTPDPVEAPK